MRYKMILQLFDDGGQGGNQGGNAGGSNNQGGNGGNQSYTYEQLNEIATSRVERAEKAAVKNFFQQKGLSEEEANTAFQQYLDQKKKSQPNVSEIERQRDEALAKVTEMENNGYLTSKGVKTEDMDYVAFKVSKMVDDKTDFKKAADKFLKENPRFAGGGYRMGGSSSADGNGSGGNNGNASINDRIRAAARR